MMAAHEVKAAIKRHLATRTIGERTPLTPEQETQFQQWIQSNHITDLDKPDSYYDYRDYWKKHGNTPMRFKVDHFPDTYKQHRHPTFSMESKYSREPNDGGRWIGDTFVG